MAIGKENAYATVTAPEVNFGDIGTNAQKFQSASLDRLKDMIPKQEKKKDFKIEGVTGGTERSSNGGYDQSVIMMANELKDENYLIDKQAELEGYYSPELTAKKQKVQSALQSLDSVTKIFSQNAQNWAKDSNDGKFSDVDKSRFDYLQKISNKRNVEISRDENGEMIFKVRKTDEEGNFLSDKETKQPLYETFNDKGSNRDYVSKYEMDNGSLFTNTIKNTKVDDAVAKLSGNIKLSTETTDPTGVRKKTITFLSDEQKKGLDKNIKAYLSDYDNLVNVLYETQDEKYSRPKSMAQYQKDGDVDVALKAMKARINGNLGYSALDVADSPKITINNGKKDEENAYLINKTTVKQKEFNGKKWSYGYELPISQTSDKIKFGGIPVQIKSTGYDRDSNRFYIAYSVSESQSKSEAVKENKEKNIGKGSNGISSKSSDVRYVWLNGKGANVTNGEILSRNIKNLNGDNYTNIEDLISDIKQKDPKGMFFGGKDKGTTKQNKKATITGGDIR
jgi:hypothetical protein